MNISQPYNGAYYEADYLESYLNRTTNKYEYKTPKRIRIKPKSDGSQGVALNVKERVRVNINGGWIEKDTFTVQVVDNNNYKIRDKIYFILEDKKYTIWKIADGVDSVNSIANLMFPKIKTNKPYVLFLGE